MRPSGYSILETLHSSERTLVYRAVHTATGARVVLKLPTNPRPGRALLDQLGRERALLRELADVPGVPRALATERVDGRAAIVMDDIGARALSAWLQGGGLRHAELLSLAARAARALARVHARGIVHRDVSPDNLVYAPDSDELQLIDFGLARRIEDASPPRAGAIEGTLEYMSPEQTGRVPRPLDARADQYSLGATMYRALTGRPPFVGESPAEIVHGHIARRPAPVHALAPELPELVSDTIARMLAKSPEDRYASASAAADALERCARRLRARRGRGVAEEEEEEEEKLDAPPSLELPSRLYGRARAHETLLNAFRRATLGGREFALISGLSGVGKSALAQSLRGPAARAGGYFVSGKFDLYKRDLPYSALLEAFGALTRLLLSDPEIDVERWRARVSATLREDAPLLIAVLPDVAHLVEETYQTTRVAHDVAERRFQRAFQGFVRSLAVREQPVVVLLDDLQWADRASLALLEGLLRDEQLRYALIIGTRRSDELDHDHPVSLALSRMREGSEGFAELSLAPLSREEVTALLADTLAQPPARVRELAELCILKTEGNPLFLRSLLHELRDEGLIRWRGETGEWSWDARRVHEVDVGDGATELLARRLATLPRATQRLLGLAATAGDRFDEEALALARELPRAELALALAPALAQGLVLARADDEAPDAGDNRALRFAHDRVREAAHQLLSEDERARQHASYGRALLRLLDDAQLDERVFEVVGHLNAAAPLLRADERLTLARLNHRAGGRARASAAHETALALCSRGIELGGDAVWREDYGLALDLHIGAAGAALACARFDQIDRYIELALPRITRPLDRARLLEVRLESLVITQNAQAVSLARSLLASLDVELPRRPSRLLVLREVLSMRAALARRTIDGLIDGPPLRSPRLQLAMRVLSLLGALAGITDELLMVVASHRQLRISLSHGTSTETAQALCMHAAIVGDLVRDIDYAYACAQAAERLIERDPQADVAPRVRVMASSLLRSWRDPLRKIWADTRDAKRLGLERGSQEIAFLTATTQDHYAVLISRPLPAAEQESRESMRQLERGMQHARVIGKELPWPSRQFMLCLMGQAEDPATLRGEIFDITTRYPGFDPGEETAAKWAINYYQILLQYLFGRHEEVVRAAEELAADPFHLVEGRSLNSPVHLYTALSRCELARRGDARRRPSLRAAAAHLRRLRFLARHAPRNHRHAQRLVEGAMAWVRDDVDAAARAFEDALQAARAEGFTREEGVAAELAARMFAERGATVAARAYAQEARYAWERWGATAKLARCEQEFARLLDPRPSARDSSQRTSEAATSRVVLDLDSVVKASQLLSEEIVYKRLLAKIMALLLENAGATSGALVLNRPIGPVVISRAAARDPGAPAPAPDGGVGLDPGALEATPLHDAEDLPVGLVSYVLRTGTPLVFNDARTDESLAHSRDAYLRARSPRAILCAPIIRASVTTGAVYLENDLIAGCFTDERLETVRILASQAAISIENATLYDELEDQVRLRTRELEEERARAEIASAAKSEFLASMSHELRTPLNAILGYSRIMLRPPGLDDSTREGLTTILRSGGHLLELIDDVLDMAKIEARRVELRPSSTSLPALLRDIVAIFEMSAREQGVTLRYRAAPELPAHVLVDEKRLRQVLLNLLGNAIKFTPDGEVRFIVDLPEEPGLPSAPAAAREGVTRVRFTVEDTGIGIPADQLTRIFDPFEQAGSDKQRARGTGLGLAISQRLVGLMGGRIRVSSQLGAGSSFSFSLPLPPAVASAGPRVASRPPERARVTATPVAVTEDSAALRPPPPAVIDELLALHRHGDLLHIAERARKLGRDSPAHGEFAAALARLADNFDDEAVRALLERARDDA